MEFRVLGPVEVEEAGRKVALGGPKPRALLAILLLRRGEVVPAERLVELLYEGLPPEKALKSVHAHVSRLRKALGDSRLRTAGGGYALDVSPDELDLGRFEQLVERGRAALGSSDPETAAASLRQALALWRGPPFADFRYRDFAQAEIARLEERRLAVLEERIVAELALGRHADLVSELEALVREHPLRERLRAQLMLALYRSGRQAEALESYREARHVLVEELGIEPGRPLRDLEQAILEQNTALDLHLESPLPDAAHAGPTSRSPEKWPAERPGRKTVTVVHVRLTASSASGGDLDPEIMRHVLNRAVREITVVIEAHEGALAVVAADSVSAVFGMPSVHEDDASRAMRAAEEIRGRLAEVARELERESSGRVETRIGVSTGEIMTGASAGSPLGATGAPLTAAATLAQSAEEGAVVADDATRRAASSRRDESRFTSPMVGRARERRRLHDVFEQAVGDRSCQLFTILGAAGVGKSRLVREFLRDIDDDALVARGRCLPYGDGITYWPVVEAIKDLIGPESASEVSPSDVAALIEGADASLVAQRLLEGIGLAETTVGVEEGFDAVRAFFEALAARLPLVVVFDDIHWGEPTFHDLVEHLADWSRGTPIVLICLARPELLDLRATWGGGKLNATSVLLEPLSDDESTELVANLVGEAELAEEVEARIAEAAEGNPLFVEEMLSMLIDDGVLVRSDGRWVAARDLTAVPIPPTIQALLAARLDQLRPEERVAIEAAAVEGKVFHEGSVVLVASEVDAPPALASLVRKELIRPDRPVFAGERAFRFRHLMIRDAAYDAVPKERRATFHERHVDWLEPKTGERSVEFDEIVGYHLEQAVRYRTELGQFDDTTHVLARRAAERLGAAGRRAFARSDSPAGLKLISRAVALLPPDDPLRVDLVPNVRVVQGVDDLGWADKVLTEAVEAAATSGDRRLAAHALVQRGLLRLFSDPSVTPNELLEVSGRTRAAFEELGDDLGMARAWRLAAQAHYLDRQLSACADASERALVFARKSKDRFEQSELVEWLVIAIIFGPTHARDAIDRCRRLLHESAGDPRLEALVLGALAPLLTMQARPADADQALARSHRVMEDAGESIWIVSYWRSLVHLWRGDADAAEQELRPPYEALKRVGDKNHFNTMTIGLANAAYMQGFFEESEALTRECEQACRPNDIYSHILWRSTRAKVLARRGEIDDALVLAREAVALGEGGDFLHSQAGAMEDLATVLSLAGHSDEALAALEIAAQRFEEKGDLLGADRARRVLTGSTRADEAPPRASR